MTRYLSWILAVYVAFVFLQSLLFKFTGSEETRIIFETIGDWMAGIGLLESVSQPFKTHGGYLIGMVELFASVLILVPRTRIWGALIGFGVISGALFFHLFTPLGVNRVVDAAGNTDGGILFYMASGVWLSCITLIAISFRRGRQSGSF